MQSPMLSRLFVTGLLLTALLVPPISSSAAPNSPITSLPPIQIQFPESHHYVHHAGPQGLAYDGDPQSPVEYAAFGSSHLYLYDEYDTGTGINSNTVTVDPAWGAGDYAAMVVGTDNYPRLSYLDQLKFQLKYAAQSASGWRVETLDTFDQAGSGNSLALQNSQYPAIAYFAPSGASGALKYIYESCQFNICSWNKETVDSMSGAGQINALGINISNQPVIAYTIGTTLYVNRKMNMAWQGRVTLDTNIRSLAMANRGDAFTLVYSSGSGSSYNLKVTSSLNGGASWSQPVTVDNHASQQGFYISAALDVSGSPYFAYDGNQGGTTDRLMLAHFVGSGGTCSGSTAWSCEIAQVDPTRRLVAQNVSLAIDNVGGVFPSIAYTDLTANAQDLKQVYKASNVWRNEAWPISETDLRGSQSQLALDSHGMAQIAYISRDSELFFTQQTSPNTWTTIQITDMLYNYQSNENGLALALDTDNTPYIAYDKAGSLYLAHPVSLGGNCGPGSSWFCDMVVSTVLWQNGSLALGLYNHKAYLAYHDVTNHELVFAQRVGSGGVGCLGTATWDCNYLDAQGSSTLDIGSYVGMTIDPNTGIATLVYTVYDTSAAPAKRSLKVDKVSAATTVAYPPVTLLDNIGVSGGMTSITGGASPQISYYQSLTSPNIGVGHAAYVGSGGTGCSLGLTAWSCELVIGSSDTAASFPLAQKTSIATDAGGHMVITYGGSSSSFWSQLNILRLVGAGGNLVNARWFWQPVDTLGMVGNFSSVALGVGGNPKISYLDQTTGHLKFADFAYRINLPVIKK